MTPKAILFDLDGTLLPMDQDAFTNAYFKELCKVLCPLGATPDTLIAAVWSGTKAMVANDGRALNADVFWQEFSEVCTLDVKACRPLCDAFYSDQFHNARIATGENPLAIDAVRLARKNGRKVVLATNPIFPLAGQASRLSWIGLKPEDFDLITPYETERFSKPNPQYYLSICERIGVDPGDCLMIGNDELEDMHAASSVGMTCWLITDCVIRSEAHPWKGPSGTFEEMLEMLRSL